MWVEDVDPRDKGWVPVGERTWLLPNGSFYTFPPDRLQKLPREVDEEPRIQLGIGLD